MRRVSFPMAETVGFILIALGMVVSSLDTMVNQAFPAIVAAFDLKPPEIKWVPLSFIPFNGLVILVFGGLGDRFGYRLIFKIGLFAAAIALLLCSLAPNYGSFLVFRALQGISAALVMSCTMALAIRILSQENRQTAVAIRVGAFFGLSAIGPIVGGILIEVLGWTSVFWSRAIVLAAVGAVICVVPSVLPGGRGEGRGEESSATFDKLGAALLTLSLVGILGAGIILLEEAIPDRLLFALFLAVIGVGFAYGYLAHAKRVVHPFLPLAVFRNVDLSSLTALSIAVNLVAFAPILWVPFYAQTLGVKWFWSTLLVAASPLGIAVAAIGLAVWPSIAQGIDRKEQLQLGGTVLGVFCIFAAAGVLLWSSPMAIVVFGVLLFGQGLGAGLFQVSYQDVVSELMKDIQGIGGSLAELTRTLGIAGGAALLSVWLPVGRRAPLAEFRPAFLWTLIFAASGLSVVLAARLIFKRRKQV
jgi:MFS family permease